MLTSGCAKVDTDSFRHDGDHGGSSNWVIVGWCRHRVTVLHVFRTMSTTENDIWKEIWNISLGLDPDAKISPNVAATWVSHKNIM